MSRKGNRYYKAGPVQPKKSNLSEKSLGSTESTSSENSIANYQDAPASMVASEKSSLEVVLGFLTKWGALLSLAGTAIPVFLWGVNIHYEVDHLTSTSTKTDSILEKHQDRLMITEKNHASTERDIQHIRSSQDEILRSLNNLQEMVTILRVNQAASNNSSPYPKVGTGDTKLDAN